MTLLILGLVTIIIVLAPTALFQYYELERSRKEVKLLAHELYKMVYLMDPRLAEKMKKGKPHETAVESEDAGWM